MPNAICRSFACQSPRSPGCSVMGQRARSTTHSSVGLGRHQRRCGCVYQIKARPRGWIGSSPFSLLAHGGRLLGGRTHASKLLTKLVGNRWIQRSTSDNSADLSVFWPTEARADMAGPMEYLHLSAQGSIEAVRWQRDFNNVREVTLVFARWRPSTCGGSPGWFRQAVCRHSSSRDFESYRRAILNTPISHDKILIGYVDKPTRSTAEISTNVCKTFFVWPREKSRGHHLSC